MAPVGVGVIGCGYWGPKLIRNFYELATAQVRMVAELQPERRGQLERQFPGVQTTANHDDVLADPAIEAVVISTPVRTHYTLAQQPLADG